jgi:preprotein translocase SecE subunit
MAEVADKKADEKKVEVPAAAPTPARPGAGLRKLAAVGVAGAGLCWGLSLGFLLSFAGWLGAPSISLSASARALLSPGGLVVGLLAGIGLAAFAMKKLGGRLAVAKPGQGRSARILAYAGIGSMALFGAYSLYWVPPVASSWWADLLPAASLMGKEFHLKPMLFPAAAVFLTVMTVAHLLLNREGWADFLIETEGEVRKVSWPARKEYLGSSFVVVLLVALVSVFLYLVDEGLSRLMRGLGIGF